MQEPPKKSSINHADREIAEMMIWLCRRGARVRIPRRGAVRIERCYQDLDKAVEIRGILSQARA